MLVVLASKRVADVYIRMSTANNELRTAFYPPVTIKDEPVE